MERRKWEPLTKDEEQEICKKCGGFCCNNFFVGLGEGDAPKEFHIFRGRKITRYGKTLSIVMPDPCPFNKQGKYGSCSVYDKRPQVCRMFPEMYVPFWSKFCKLMRERYKRGQIKRNNKKFNQILKEIGKNPKSPFKYFKVEET